MTQLFGTYSQAESVRHIQFKGLRLLARSKRVPELSIVVFRNTECIARGLLTEGPQVVMLSFATYQCDANWVRSLIQDFVS